MSDDKKERDDRLRAKGRELAERLTRMLPPHLGFTLFVFEYGDPGKGITYLSTAPRDEMIRTIEEWLTIQKALQKEPGHV